MAILLLLLLKKDPKRSAVSGRTSDLAYLCMYKPGYTNESRSICKMYINRDEYEYAYMPSKSIDCTWISSAVGSVRCRHIARFIFAGSSTQLDRPTMEIGGSTSIPCSTFSGKSKSDSMTKDNRLQSVVKILY